MTNVKKVIVEISYRLKPILIKVIPISFLRKIKKLIVKSSIKSMNDINIKQYNKYKYQNGINLIGNIRAETGLGQSCRLIANSLKQSDLKFMIYNYTQIGIVRTNDVSWDAKISMDILYNINLIHINPHEMGLAFLQLDRSIWDYRYNIAFWLWELEDFPDEWLNCIECVNEIWTPSEFTSSSIRKKTNKPVHTIPYCITAPYDKKYNRLYFNLPEKQFLFLIMYDSSSIMERKNPMAAIEAFKVAYKKTKKNIGLVIKINNVNIKDIDIINESLEGLQNVYIITDILEKTQVNSLIKCVDVFVSLHRAEGFGLVLSEAMLLGTPTIATNWSSNTEFMNDDVSCLVNYELVTIEQDLGPFKRGYRWANPDIYHAASYMIKLIEDQGYYNDVAIKAKKHISDKLGMRRATSLIKDRVKEIYEEFL